MPNRLPSFLIAAIQFFSATPAHAEFSITSAIVEFTADKPRPQDIEVVSRSNETQYIVSEVYEIRNPGLPNEERVLVEDPSQAKLLVTPDRLVLGAGARKLLRFVLLDEPGTAERVYRVVVKPVIKGVDSKSQVGLKVLVGYEALVLVRPAAIKTSYQAERQGSDIVVTNRGNSDILLQNGTLCPPGTTPPSDKCQLPPVLRIYPGQTATMTLPQDWPVTYSVWDGAETTIRHFD